MDRASDIDIHLRSAEEMRKRDGKASYLYNSNAQQESGNKVITRKLRPNKINNTHAGVLDADGQNVFNSGLTSGGNDKGLYS